MNMKAILLTLATSLPLLAGDRPSIKVLGVAEERVPPDQLQLSCTIRNEGKELAEVATANRERAGEVTKLLREQGLGEAEITTGSAAFGENTEYKGGRHIKIGYVATTSIYVATGKLALYDKLWFELAKFPEVSINAAGFTLKDRSEVRATARKKALEAARRKAGEMAGALDTRIGAPLSIVENPQASPFSSSNISSNSIHAAPSGDSESEPLEPGLVSVVERVEVTFELIGKDGAASAQTKYGRKTDGRSLLDPMVALFCEEASKDRKEPVKIPSSEFSVSESKIDGLWEQLGIQLFSLNHENRDDFGFYLYADGGLRPVPMDTFGSLVKGPEQMILYKDALYFTNSWGSGVLRTELHRIRRDKDSKVVIEGLGVIGSSSPTMVDKKLLEEEPTRTVLDKMGVLGRGKLLERLLEP